LKAFRTPATVQAASLAIGRYPKPSTEGDMKARDFVAQPVFKLPYDAK